MGTTTSGNFVNDNDINNGTLLELLIRHARHVQLDA
jgi:hypothetical protein